MESNRNLRVSDRIWYFDLLRIFATFGVVFLHVMAVKWYDVGVNSFEWHLFNSGDTVVRWCVPIFVMISGTLFLDADISFKKILKKNVLRIVTAFAFWSLVYVIKGYIIWGGSLEIAVRDFIIGHRHMWFLFMIAGLYLIIPFAKKLVESEQLTKYFLLLSLIFTFIIPQCIMIAKFFYPLFGNGLDSAVEKMNFNFVLGYAGYFILGYCLNKIELSKKLKRVIYILGILGFVITFFATMFFSTYQNKPYNSFYNYLTVNVLMESVGVFVFFKSRFGSYKPDKKAKERISALSKYSFGIYLVHPLVMELLDKFLNFNPLSFNAVLASLLLFVTVSLLSLIISVLFNRIPYLNKYIV